MSYSVRHSVALSSFMCEYGTGELASQSLPFAQAEDGIPQTRSVVVVFLETAYM